MKQWSSLLFFVFSFLSSGIAQTNEYEWRNNMRLAVYSSSSRINVHDARGNSYFFSTIEDTVNIQTVGGEKQIVAKNRRILLQKITAEGRTQWYKVLKENWFCSAAVNSEGNVVYIGYEKKENETFQFFMETISGDGTVLGKINLFKPVPELFIRYCRVNKILIDEDDNILLTGWLKDKFHFNEEIPVSVNSNYDRDPFILKLDKAGNVIWYKTIDGPRDESISGICLHNNNIFLTGSFENDIQLGAQTYISNGKTDLFISKITTSGEIEFFNTIGGKDADNGYNITTDGNNIYVTGNFRDTVNFDPRRGNEVNVSNNGSNSFILKVDHEGHFVWINSMIRANGWNGSETELRVFGDSILWSGMFEGDLDVDPNSTIIKLSSDSNEYDRFPSRFIQIGSTDGEFLDAFTLDNYRSGQIEQISFLSNSSYQVVAKRLVEVDKSDRHYELSLDQYTFPKKNDSIFTIVACKSYFWSITGENYTASGTYRGENPETKRPVQLDLEIYEMDSEIMRRGDYMHTKEENASYQWLECSEGCQQIEGAIQESYRPEKSGNYRLELTSTMCQSVDTSNMIYVEILELDRRTLDLFYDLNYEITIDDIEKVHLPLDGEKVKMIPFRVDEFYGFVENGDPNNWIVQPKFEQVFAVYETGAIVKDSLTEAYGFINNSGEYVIPPYFHQIEKEQNVLHATSIFVRDTSLHLPPSHNHFNYHAFFDLNGKELFTEYAHDQGNFKGEDFAWFRFGKDVRIRDLKGSLVDSFQVDTTRYFLGVADANLIFKHVGSSWEDTIVAYNLDWDEEFRMRLNTHGKVYKINENLFGVSDARDFSYYFVDKNGRGSRYSFQDHEVADMLLSETYFSQEYFVVRDQDLEKCGVIDRSGKVIVPFIYNHISQQVNGYWECLGKSRRAEYINSKGEIVWVDKEPIFGGYSREINRYTLAEPKGFHDGLSFAWKNNYIQGKDGYSIDSSYFYYFDIEGNELFSLDTSILLSGNFSEGLAPVVTTSKGLGFIDKTGKMVIQPNYELVVAGQYLGMYFVIPRFIGGYAYVKSHKGYIDKNGKEFFSGKRMQDHYDFSH